MAFKTLGRLDKAAPISGTRTAKTIAMMTKTLLAAFTLAIMAGAAHAQETAAPASTLPGGASSLQETYQDWQVACVQQEAGKRCAMLQQQAQQNGQRILSVELVPAAGQNVLGGALVLPFGLALEAGVTLQVDETGAPQPQRFSTCLPAGCLVPLSFNEAMLGGLRSGTALNVNATAMANGQPVALSVSLAGFSAALERAQSLVQ